jgi:hypothetical protein
MPTKRDVVKQKESIEKLRQLSADLQQTLYQLTAEVEKQAADNQTSTNTGNDDVIDAEFTEK